jgi:8-oxo-dGTP pyrophosphatase MutT (NUDIX family)
MRQSGAIRMAEDLETAVVEAAGGIVERAAPDGPRIAVIRRERYGTEWALPKGKRQRGESWQETGLREVEEEIGIRPVIIGVAGATAYVADGVAKLVLYWRMRATGDLQPFVPNEEVSMIEWMTPDSALLRLSHREEAHLVRTTFGLDRRT